jgi:hypothetical protein
LIPFYTGQRTAPIVITARIAANGPAITAAYALYDVNNPPQVELPPQNQQGTSASWTLSAASLAAVPGSTDSLVLWLANRSPSQISVDVWLTVKQGGAALAAVGPTGQPIAQNAAGEIQLDTVAYATNDNLPFFIRFGP